MGSSGAVGVPGPAVAPVCRLERRRPLRTGGVRHTSREGPALITSRRPAPPAAAAIVLAVARGQWGSENQVHDVPVGEAARPIRTGAAPPVRSAGTNRVIARRRRTGGTTLAARVPRSAASAPQAWRDEMALSGRGLPGAYDATAGSRRRSSDGWAARRSIGT